MVIGWRYPSSRILLKSVSSPASHSVIGLSYERCIWPDSIANVRAYTAQCAFKYLGTLWWRKNWFIKRWFSLDKLDLPVIHKREVRSDCAFSTYEGALLVAKQLRKLSSGCLVTRVFGVLINPPVSSRIRAQWHVLALESLQLSI